MTLTSSKPSSRKRQIQTAHLPTLAEVEAERCKRKLSYYVRKVWPIVEPATEYLHNWHIDLISDYLEAVTFGEIHNLIVNIPPRHMKSLQVSVVWPTWVWTFWPESRWLFSSYGESLAIRDALKSRRIIQSAWYQERWGSVFELTGDQNQKSRYENDKTGFRVSVGVQGLATGEGGDFVVTDDPLKAQDADSDLIRNGVNDWWDGTMSTRGNDPKKAARVIIMQRLHDDDLTGHVLEKMSEEGALQYEHLCLPTEYEPHRFFPAAGLPDDPRTEPGELLWPERFGPEEVAAAKVSLGVRGYAGQHQQRPAPAGGNIFQSAWWDVSGPNRYDPADRSLAIKAIARWLSWDTALKDEENNDYTARGVVELLPDYRLIVRSSWKRKLQFPQLSGEIEQHARYWNQDGKLRGILIEDKGSGISALQTLKQAAPEWLADLLVAWQPKGSKEYRARQASSWCEKGCILLPLPGDQASWLFDFEQVLYKFPAVKHDDEVDWFSQIIVYLEHYIAEGWRARNGL